MFRSWKFIFLATMSVLLLASCGQSTLEDGISRGMKAAEEAFYANDKNHTEEIDGIKLYKPAGFKVIDDSDEQNVVFSKSNDTFILFVNPNEKQDSQLFYDLLEVDQNKDIIAEQTFSEEGAFGFAAIIRDADGQVELVASVGGAKMTALTQEKRIDEHLPRMMEVVRSIR